MARRKHLHAWHYEGDGQKLGPIAEDDLIDLISNGAIQASTAVWRQGMDEWLAASTTELAKHFDETGGPTPETVQATMAHDAKIKALSLIHI